MCMEDQPCRYCRQALKEEPSKRGVAGLFDDNPEHIALIPSELEEAREPVQDPGKRAEEEEPQPLPMAEMEDSESLDEEEATSEEEPIAPIS